MEDTRNAGRRNTRGEATRRHLIDAAVAQLAAHGMGSLTHRLVEERAGVAQGSIKHHFGSREGLIEAVLEHMVAIDLPLVLRPSDDIDPVRLAEQAQRVMAAVFARPDLNRARFELYVYAAGHPTLQAVIGAARQRFVDAISATLPGPDSEIAARFVAAVMDGLVLDQLSAPHPSIDAHAGSMVVYAGMAARMLAAQPIEAARENGVPSPDPTP